PLALLVGERDDAGAGHALVLGAELLARALDRGELGPGLLEGDAGPEPADHADEAVLQLPGARDEGDPEVGAGGEAVFAAQDADDGARRAVDADGPADDPRVGAEVLPPDLLRQNDDVVASRLALFRHEAAAEEWAGAE